MTIDWGWGWGMGLWMLGGLALTGVECDSLGVGERERGCNCKEGRRGLKLSGHAARGAIEQRDGCGSWGTARNLPGRSRRRPPPREGEGPQQDRPYNEVADTLHLRTTVAQPSRRRGRALHRTQAGRPVRRPGDPGRRAGDRDRRPDGAAPTERKLGVGRPPRLDPVLARRQHAEESVDTGREYVEADPLEVWSHSSSCRATSSSARTSRGSRRSRSSIRWSRCPSRASPRSCRSRARRASG